ncbi:MAG: UvrD-helicase domain-containing protein, partial [Ignavibacteria bacterium]
ILHKYYFFSVLTIDSFFQRIIRSFSKELNLYIGYNLELDEKDVMEKITDELLDTIGENKELTRFLENFVYYNIEENKDWKIDRQLRDTGMEIFKERYWELKQKFEEDVLDKAKVGGIIRKLRDIVSGFEKTMAQISVKSEEFMVKHGLTIDDFSNKSGGVMGYLLNKIGYKKDYEPTIRIFNACEDKTTWYTKNFINKQKVLGAVNGGLFELLNQAVSLWKDDFKSYNTARVLLKTIHVLGVLSDLLERLKIYRDENKIMLLSDANNILQRLTADMESAPFVYEKTGNRFKYFLIDEFQDTSTFQWMNLLPLVVNSLGEGNLSMVVGDVKQSIYRWRNGNMRLLLEKVYDDLGLFKNVIVDRTLTENHRSKKNIVEFNNKVFSLAPDYIIEHILKRESNLIKNAYSDCKQIPSGIKNSGYVEIEYIPEDKDEESNPYIKTIQSVIRIVNELKEEKISLKDILILTRTKEEASDIAKALSGENIPVISADSLFLYNSPRVKLILNLIKYIIDNRNLLAKTEALYNYSIINPHADDFDKIFSDNIVPGESTFAAIMPVDFFGRDKNGETDSRRLNPALNNYSLYELVESLIRIFKLTSPDSYLMRFMDIIHDYSSKYSGNITGFLKWWEESKSEYSIIVPEEAEAVRIMTIHKAKGLQSLVVIVPFIKWPIDRELRKTTMWADSDEEEPFDSAPYLVEVTKSLEETYFEQQYFEERELLCLDNLNLLYVAFTRAVERLYGVIIPKEMKGETIGTVLHKLIITDTELQNFYDYDKNLFKFGKKTAIIAKSGGDRTQVFLNEFVSNDLYSRITIRPRHESLKLVKDKDFSDKTQWGLVVHEALSYINNPDDVVKAVDKIVAGGLISASESPVLLKYLELIFSKDDVKSLFASGNRVITECNILLPDGKIIRPDRVFVKNNNAIVVDYKTGKQKDEHTKQVNDYALTLEQMGYKPVEKYLLYVEEPNLIKIP